MKYAEEYGLIIDSIALVKERGFDPFVRAYFVDQIRTLLFESGLSKVLFEESGIRTTQDATASDGIALFEIRFLLDELCSKEYLVNLSMLRREFGLSESDICRRMSYEDLSLLCKILINLDRMKERLSATALHSPLKPQ